MALPPLQVGSLPFDKLSDSNWLSWSIRFKAYLVSQNLWDIIENLPAQLTPADQQKDERALALLQLSVSDSLLVHLHNILHAQTAWNLFKDMFQRQSSGSKIILMRQLFNLKHEEGTPVQTHVTKVVALFSELRARDIIFPPEQQALILMGSLSRPFYAFMDSLHGIPDRDLTIPFISGKIMEFEAQRKLRSFAPMQKSSSSGTASNDTACVAKPKSQIVCFKCKKKGHYAKNCKQNPGQWRNKQVERPSSSKDLQHAFLVTSKKDTMNSFIIDSGCSQHLVKTIELLTNVRDSDINFISLADDRKVKVFSCGDLYIDSLKCTLENVYYVPEIMYNILSVNKLLDEGFEVSLKKEKSMLIDLQGNEVQLRQEKGFFVLKSATNVSACIKQIPDNPRPLHDKCIHEFHRKMGHLSWQYLRQTAELCEIPIQGCKNFLDCEICAAENLKKAPIAKYSARVSKRILELVHIDVSGPHPTSVGGSKYFLILVDDFSRLKFTFFLRTKGEVFQKISAWLKLMQTQFPEYPVQAFQSDRGAEFMSKQMQNLLEKFGIVHRLTNPYSPSENGVAERWIGVVKVVARKMLRDASLSDGLWAEAVANATFVLNRSFCKSVNSIPYVLFFGKTPDLSSIRVFGSDSYVLIPSQQRHKKDSIWKKLKYLGPASESKGWRFWCGNNRVLVSKNVKFQQHSGWERIHSNKEVFLPFNTTQMHTPLTTQPTTQQVSQRPATQVQSVSQQTAQQNIQPSTSQDTQFGTQVQVKQESVSSQLQGSSPVIKRTEPQKRKAEAESSSSESTSSSNSETDETDGGDSTRTIPRRSSRTTKGIPPKRYHCEVVKIQEHDWSEPQSYKEMLKRDETERNLWLKAMQSEFDSLKDLQVMEKSKTVDNVKVLSCRWVYRRKQTKDGGFLYKARLVARGFEQIYGENFNEIFSPTVSGEALKIALAIASNRNLKVKHFDVNTAYLHADLEEKVYISAIPGFESDLPEGTYLLKKSLYGLKQSARNWNLHLDKVLTKLNFVANSFDPCLYSKGSGDTQMFIVIYVDDVLCIGSEENIQEVFQNLSKVLKIKNLGDVSRYLGINIARNESGFELNQTDKIYDLLRRTRMENANTVNTPMALQFLQHVDGEVFDNNFIYRSVIGSLLYIANNTRPDISFSVGILSQRIQNPSHTDWAGVKRVLRYLKQTAEKVFRICPDDKKSLEIHCDSSFANLKENKSVTGFVIKYANTPVCWKSRKQNIVALSTGEAEFSALSDALSSAEWLESLIKSLNIDLELPIQVFVDSQTCIALCKNQNMKTKSRYINVRYSNVQQFVKDKRIVLNYVPSVENVADILTKPLTCEKHNQFCEKLNL